MAANLRYELSAYSDTDACRLAAILLELCSQQLVSYVSRDEVAARWAALYPRHVAQKGRQAIRHRMVDGLTLLKTAGIAAGDGESIIVMSGDRLAISARNLSIVQDAQGVAVRPGLWPRAIEAPAHLAAVAAAREAERQATIRGQRNDG